MNRHLLLDNVETDAATLAEAAEAVVVRARTERGGYVCLCNVHLLMVARKDDSVRDALNGAYRVFADGAPVAWLQRRQGVPTARRVAGTELFHMVLDRGRQDDIRHVFFGATDEKLRSLARAVEASHPGVIIAGVVAPPIGQLADLGSPWIEEIEALRPDIVWCALGAPKQELWMSLHKDALAPAVLVGVGAAFDFVAGSKSRAPGWMRALGLEWAHRLSTEPRRLASRYASTNALFAYAVISDRFARRAGSAGRRR
jgi:N-acetylglucosaminyldiphosphoundecaprenol N-acetyl-beta-D-mannosaminyltransferase